MKTLILFTSCYPFNFLETYLEVEIPYLSEVFGEIHIISNEKDTSSKRETPANVQSYSTPYSLKFFDKLFSWFQIFNPEFWYEIQFVRTRYEQRITFQIINTILQSLYKAKKLKKKLTKLIPDILNRKDITMYSYWANDNAVAIAYLKKKYPFIKAVTRAHRFDVYFGDNKMGYLPFRKLLAENLDHIYFISAHAKNYFINKTGLNKNSFEVSRLGVYSFISPLRNVNPGVYHLVSCSYVYARKRVDLIAKALDSIDEKYRVKWTHIGGGDHSMSELQDFTKGLLERKKNITIDLKGRMAQSEIKTFYEQNYVDLFINVSESEGVPVSIMESFSASIPALATDADGTREIVIHNLTGILINCDFTTSELAFNIQEYLDLPDEAKSVYRLNARKMYLEKYNEANNYKGFVASLLKISAP